VILVLEIAYDGAPFLGWRKNNQGPSIEAALEKALTQILQEPVLINAASRTDRGVHALGQVVGVTTSNPPKNLQSFVIGLNSQLPPEIRCLSVKTAPDSFHPTLDAKAKEYRYSISLGPVQIPLLRHTHWHVHYDLDFSLLTQAKDLFIGTHDFRGLCNWRKGLKEDDTIRTVFDISLEQSENALFFTFKGDRFLYKMVRNIVGTCIWIARGKISLSSAQEALKTRKRSHAGTTAPAHGLTLISVSY